MKLTATQVARAVRAIIESKGRLLIKGPPGIGKTEIVESEARKANAKFFALRPAISEPTDFRGLPWIVQGKGEFVPIGELEAIFNAKEHSVVFLDDVGQAAEAVQAAVMHMVDRLRANPNIAIIGATNERHHKAGVRGLLEPVKSRFGAIVEMVPDLDAWKDWALNNDVDYRVIAYITQHREALHKWEPSQDLINQPCPRTWAAASRIMGLDVDSDTRFALLCGAIGEPTGTAFMAWCKIAEDAPSREDVIANPKGAPIPERPDAIYAVVSSLAVGVVVKEFGAIATYATRLYKAGHGEFCSLLLRDVYRQVPAVAKTKEFAELAKGEVGPMLIDAVRMFNQ